MEINRDKQFEFEKPGQFDLSVSIIQYLRQCQNLLFRSLSTISRNPSNRFGKSAARNERNNYLNRLNLKSQGNLIYPYRLSNPCSYYLGLKNLIIEL